MEADRKDRLAENSPDLEPIRELASSPSLLKKFSDVGERAKKEIIIPADVNSFGAYLFTLFMYFNGQRPGSVAGFTITDASKATWQDCGGKQQLVLWCSSHKTDKVKTSSNITNNCICPYVFSSTLHYIIIHSNYHLIQSYQ